MKTTVKWLIVLLLFVLLIHGQRKGTNPCVNQGLNEDIKRVEAVVGRDVTLPCFLKVPFNADDILEWSKGDSEIYTIRDGKQNNSKEPRASVPMEDSEKRNVSLKLSGVTKSDEARYSVCVKRNNGRNCATINLTISEEKKDESKENKDSKWVHIQTTETPLDSGGGPGDTMNCKGLIIGLIVSVVLNLVLAAVVGRYCYKTTASKPRSCEVHSCPSPTTCTLCALLKGT